MFHSVVPAAFEYVHKPRNVALNVRMRVLERITNPGLRSEVNNALKSACGKKRRRRFPISHVAIDKTKI